MSYLLVNWHKVHENNKIAEIEYRSNQSNPAKSRMRGKLLNYWVSSLQIIDPDTRIKIFTWLSWLYHLAQPAYFNGH